MSSKESDSIQIIEDDDITTVIYNAWVELFAQFPDICLKGSDIYLAVLKKRKKAQQEIAKEITKRFKLDMTAGKVAKAFATRTTRIKKKFDAKKTGE